MRNAKPAQADVDWGQVRARLAQALAATEALDRPSPEQLQEILAERARRLAPPVAVPGPDTETLDVVRFAVGGETYAIESRFVREVARLADLTPVPGAPDFFVGVTNLHGEALPVIDLRRFFGLPAKGLTDRSRVVVLGRDTAEVGLLADTVLDTAGLATAELYAASELASSIDRIFLKGITNAAVVVLDGAALLDDPRLFANPDDGSGRKAEGDAT